MVILILEHFMLPVLSYKGTNGLPRHGFEILKTHNPHFNLSAILFMKLKKEILNNQSNIIPAFRIFKSKPTIYWSLLLSKAHVSCSVTPPHTQTCPSSQKTVYFASFLGLGQQKELKFVSLLNGGQKAL